MALSILGDTWKGVIVKSIDWENAVNIRKSTRAYELLPVERVTLSLLQSFIGDIQAPIEHNVTIRFLKANPDKKLYTAYLAPPDGAAFLSATDA